MTNMRASVFVYWIIVFQSMLFNSIVHARDRQANDFSTVTDLQRITSKRTILKLLHSSWITNEWIRSKRNKETEEAMIPTRHAKHRKRRRCRNRSSCFRGTPATRLILLRDNDTIPMDRTLKESKENRDLSNTVLEREKESREQSWMNDREQEYNETKGEDYDATDIDEEKGKSGSKEQSFIVAETNVSVDGDLLDSELIDPYDERSVSSEMAKSRSKKDKINDGTDYMDEERPSAIYSAIDDQVPIHESLSVLLSKLFQSLRNASATDGQDIFKELNFVNGTNEDPCQKWLNSKDKLEQVFLGGLASLPACPCQYPSNIFYDDKIWDGRRKRYFRWRDVSGGSQRLDVYKPGATYCVRSLLMQGSGSAAAQHCCYDRNRKLLTRGSGAGTPNFVSPEISPLLHEKIDVLPWRLCKGDFSRYNGVRPPDNDNGCEANPDDEEYQRQIDNTKYY